MHRSLIWKPPPSFGEVKFTKCCSCYTVADSQLFKTGVCLDTSKVSWGHWKPVFQAIPPQ